MTKSFGSSVPVRIAMLAAAAVMIAGGTARAADWTFHVQVEYCSTHPPVVPPSVGNVTVSVASLDVPRPILVEVTDTTGLLTFVLTDVTPPERLRISWTDAGDGGSIDVAVENGSREDYQFVSDTIAAQPCQIIVKGDRVTLRTEDLPVE